MRDIPSGCTLVGGCALVGTGVGLVLCARLGSDGYSTLVNGISLAARMPYAFANWTLGLGLVVVAWARRVRPGVGTIVHPFVVGGTVDLVLFLGTPGSLPARIVLLGVGAVVLALGVAVYLSAALGSGPFESAALALRPLTFRTAYVLLQAIGTAVGWSLGAAAGPGTLLIVFGVGPLVTVIRRSRLLRRIQQGESDRPPRSGREASVDHQGRAGDI